SASRTSRKKGDGRPRRCRRPGKRRRFFFQAEDGIRDYKVTGVQTCALPISTAVVETTSDNRGCSQVTPEIGITSTPVLYRPANRSEERRVGKECRSHWSPAGSTSTRKYR